MPVVQNNIEFLSVDIKLLVTWNRVRVGKLIPAPLVKKFHQIYRAGIFITVFTRIRHWYLPCSPLQKCKIARTISVLSILILSRTSLNKQLKSKGNNKESLWLKKKNTACTVHKVIYFHRYFIIRFNA